jgi:hypothetical protein
MSVAWLWRTLVGGADRGWDVNHQLVNAGTTEQDHRHDQGEQAHSGDRRRGGSG